MFCVSKWFAVTVIGIVLCMGGCATTSTRPYLLSPDGIGVAILSPPPAKAAVVESNLVDAEGPAAGGMRNGFGGPLVPLGLIIAPFALAADASVCDQKLDAAYPGLPERISEIGQREFSPADVQDQFVAVLQEGTSVPVAREEIFLGNDKGAGEQQLLAAAAKYARAHIFIVEISSVSLQPFGKGCDSWKIWAKNANSALEGRRQIAHSLLLLRFPATIRDGSTCRGEVGIRRTGGTSVAAQVDIRGRSEEVFLSRNVSTPTISAPSTFTAKVTLRSSAGPADHRLM